MKLPLATVLAAAQNWLTVTVYGYVSDLLRNALRRRPIWSAHSIRLATGYYHYSPRTARYWHNIGLRLPSRSTTRKYIGKCLRSPGSCPKVLSTLKHMALSLVESQRLVTISTDGLKINSALHYEKHLDRIAGFEDWGAAACGRTDKVVNKLEAVWLRGLQGQNKQPIAYYLVQGCSGRDRFKLMMGECI